MVFKLHFVLIYSANSYILSGKVLINIEKKKTLYKSCISQKYPWESQCWFQQFTIVEMISRIHLQLVPSKLVLLASLEIALLNWSVCVWHAKARKTERLEFRAEKGVLQGQARPGQLTLQSPELPDSLGGTIFYRQNSQKGLQVMWPSSDCWWWGKRVVFQESQSLALWFQPVWDPHASA